MRYTVRGREIRSENAAKPSSSAGKWMLDWIRGLPRKSKGLDIGCGKLRYTIPLAKRIASVAAVDSKVQITRQQRLFGKTRSIKSYAAKSVTNVRVYAIEDKEWRRKRYQVVLCSNVLSAIPCQKTRRQLVRTAYRCLDSAGIFLVTTQFRNSHFNKWRTSTIADPYLDGFLVHKGLRTTFYGLIDAQSLKLLCRRCGLSVHESGHINELAYVIAKRHNSQRTAAGRGRVTR